MPASDSTLQQTFKRLLVEAKQNEARFSAVLPEPKYSPNAPATFCFWALVRNLVVTGEADHWKPGDTADLCHAVMSAAYAEFATLDKRWKRRIENLPQPNGLAKIYFAPELEQFVADIEAALEAVPYVRTPMEFKDYGPDGGRGETDRANRDRKSSPGRGPSRRGRE